MVGPLNVRLQEEMISSAPFRHPAIVEMHLPGGFTQVRLYKLAHGYGFWEIPTEAIPSHLRSIGSKFIVTVPRFAVEETDTPESLRAESRRVYVEEINEEDA